MTPGSWPELLSECISSFNRVDQGPWCARRCSGCPHGVGGRGQALCMSDGSGSFRKGLVKECFGWRRESGERQRGSWVGSRGLRQVEEA